MRHSPFYSERKAIAAMGPIRRRAHWVIRSAYFSVPSRWLWTDAQTAKPTLFARFLFPVWRLYRRTWPA